MTRLFDAPSYNAGVDACRGVIATVAQEIEARFAAVLHRREIGEVFGVLAAELAGLRIEPNGEPPAITPVGGPQPSSPPLQSMESAINGQYKLIGPLAPVRWPVVAGPSIASLRSAATGRLAFAARSGRESGRSGHGLEKIGGRSVKIFCYLESPYAGDIEANVA